jgi:CelD/BcsL family acetyltransferase involved in cellulose biosynthesis
MEQSATHFDAPAPRVAPLADEPLHRLPIRVRLIRTATALERLGPAWDRLHAAASVASVFNGWSWLATWWRLYGQGRELHVMVATRGEAVVGILPLYIDTATHFGLRVRLLRLLGDGGDSHPDDLGPLLAPGQEAQVAQTLAAAMLDLPVFDVAELNDIDSRSAFPAAVAAVAGHAQLRCAVQPCQRIAYLRLPPDWDAFLAGLSANRRSQLRRKRAKLAAAYPTRFFIWDDAGRLAEAVQHLAALHRKRWRDVSESFASREYLELHLSGMRAALPRDELRLYCLEIAGELRAMLYAYRLRRRIFVVQAGFDPQYARLSPGAVLLDHALEHAIAEGNEIVDFLRGEHEYKERLASDRRETLRVSAFRPTVGAAAFRARHVVLKRAKAKLRELARTANVF